MKIKNGERICLNASILFIVGIQIKQILVSASERHDSTNYPCPERNTIIYPCSCFNKSDEKLHIQCKNTNLAVLSVALQNIASLGYPIDDIEINNGNFENLFGPIFSKSKSRLLTIAETNIKTIADYTFFGINQTLEELHLIHSNITSLSKHNLGNLGKLSQLIIDGHLLGSLNKNIFLDQAISNSIEVLRITNGILYDLPVESFQTLRKLKTLDLHGNNFAALKKNQFRNLREIESLDISFNNIAKLEANHISDLTKLGWCNLSHNALTDVLRGTFARNAVLKVLNLSHNKIARLDGNSFRGMRLLRRLYLNDNRITDIGRGTFGSLTRIGTIDLSRNQIKKIQYQMFSELKYIEVLDIAENNIKLIEKNSFKNIYQATINISHNEIDDIEAFSFENCVNITVLDLAFNRLNNLSKNTFDTTTFATELQLAHNNLSDLGQVPLQNMTGLKVLNASYNQIQTIPKNCFPKLYELHTIDVAHNNISYISNGVFQTLLSLRVLNISYNSLTEIRASVFGTLPTLLEMDISHNHLNSISKGAFAKMTSLRYLRIHNNKLDKVFQIPISLNELYIHDNSIRHIPSELWPVMNSLLLLDLSDNKIGDSLEEGSFKGLLVLQKLILNNNGITQPPVKGLTGMTTLQYLYLQANNITQLKKTAFGKLPVLFELNLYKNGIKDISKLAFEGLLQLLTLNLSANAISSIANEAFLGLPSLRNLDLSHNFLSKLDNKTNGILDDLLSLEKLNLSYNKISFVTKKTFPSNQYIPYNLKYLDLSHNQMPVLTYDITFGTKKLRNLNLSNNQLNEIRKGVLGNLTSLEIINLSHNELSNLKSDEHIFNVPPQLKEIYLNNNKIYQIQFETFLKDPRMNVIDLRNNRLDQFSLSLLRNLQNGTRVLFSGNPLVCNCAIRPLKHYMIYNMNLDENILNITCASPIYLSSKRLVNVNDEHLQCAVENSQLYEKYIYEILPDIRFRDVILENNNIQVTWFVSGIANDIAGFTLYIRSEENEVLFQNDYLYNARSAVIPTNLYLNVSTVTLENAEVCIISRNSYGKVGRWFKAQCRQVSLLALRNKWYSSASSMSQLMEYKWYLFFYFCFCITR